MGRSSSRVRWLAVLVVAVVLCAVPIVLNLRPAHAARIDPQTLRSRIAASRSRAYQGYAQTIGLLPLPPLPHLERVSALVSTTTEMRTWYAAADRWRVDVLGPGTENDVYQTPQAEYVWDYGQNQLSRIDGDQPVRLPRAADLTPPALVRTLLGAAAGDRFEALAGRRLAGIDAAGLRIVPATADTTVDHIDIWADPASGLPVQAEVTARGGSRAVFVTRFLELHLSTPVTAVLTPPTRSDRIGYTVTDAPDLLSAINRRGFGGLPDRLAGESRRDAVAEVSAAGVYGTGLDEFIVVALPGRLGDEAYRQVAAYGTAVSVPRGDASVIATGLLTVLVVRGERTDGARTFGDRTYLVAGMVQPALMNRVAGDLA